ncbi:MAG: peptidoglycan editing factor PgeF [Janthinobacterium lividum]
MRPRWRVAGNVQAFATTRAGGYSRSPYDAGAAGGDAGGLNLGTHTGDVPDDVSRNRQRIAALVGAPIAWLSQVHGTTVVNAGDVLREARPGASPPQADACVSDQPGEVCAILTADCLPILLCDARGRAVGAAHAGWRGLVDGVIEQTAQAVMELAGTGTRLAAYLGPAIGATAFEVGAEVREAYLDAALPAERDATSRAFQPISFERAAPLHGGTKYLGDLLALATLRLARVGCSDIDAAACCTVTDRRFYSYRRDGVTGRMASFIWLGDRVGGS